MSRVVTLGRATQGRLLLERLHRPRAHRSADTADAPSSARTYEGQTLTGRVLLDGASFENCRFVDAVLVYRGVMGLGLSGCAFQNVRFEFEGPAANTLAVLQAMTAPNSGMREVVKRSFPILFAH